MEILKKFAHFKMHYKLNIDLIKINVVFQMKNVLFSSINLITIDAIKMFYD